MTTTEERIDGLAKRPRVACASIVLRCRNGSATQP